MYKKISKESKKRCPLSVEFMRTLALEKLPVAATPASKSLKVEDIQEYKFKDNRCTGSPSFS